MPRTRRVVLVYFSKPVPASVICLRARSVRILGQARARDSVIAGADFFTTEVWTPGGW